MLVRQSRRTSTAAPRADLPKAGRLKGNPKARQKALPICLRNLPPLGTVTVPNDDLLAYVCIVDGDCLAPDIQHGDMVVFSPETEIQPGMYVGLNFKDGRRGVVKRMISPLYGPPKAGDEVEFMIRVEMTNPPQQKCAMTKMHKSHLQRQQRPAG